MTSRFRFAALALLALFATPAFAADAFTTPDEKAVAAADTAFFEASLKDKGAAWGDFADPTATFSYGKGKDAISAFYNKAYAEPGFSLVWHPTYAKVVGDVAVTSGPWESHGLDKSGKDVKTTGHYVTVWQRQKDGAWRYAWDGGTDDK
jgi:ketosteroid isomerase-like protein